MTVLIYVNMSKQVGEADYLKVFANVDAAETWFEENDAEGVAFEYVVNGQHRIGRRGIGDIGIKRRLLHGLSRSRLFMDQLWLGSLAH